MSAEFRLTASVYRQVTERDDAGRPVKVVKHRRGAKITGLSDADVVRLLKVGAIVPFDDSPAGDSTDGDQSGDAAADTDATVEKPAKTAAVAAWRKYALWAKAHGVAGAVIGDLSDDDIAEMDRKDLIEALP